MAASRASRAAAPRPRNLIRFAPDSQAELLAGIETLERVLGPTIGPAGRPVVMSKIGRPREVPERLLDGATIARRMTGLPDAFPNMGLMLARHGAWRARASGGDSAALSVVILARALRTACRFAAGGANRAGLRIGIERARGRILAELQTRVEPLEPDVIRPFAETLARDPVVADLVVRAAGAVGLDSVIVAMESRGRGLDLEIVDGSLWETSAVIGPMQAESRAGYAWLTDPAVLLWDAPADDVRQFATCLDRLRGHGIRSLVFMARSFRPDLLGLLALNSLPDFTLVPVEIPHEGAEQRHAVGDISALTGARVLLREAGDRLDMVDLADLGSASRVVVGRRMLNIRAGASAAVAARRAEIEHLLERAEDDGERRRLLTRLGRLNGGMAVVWVGAPTVTQRADRMADVERALGGVRSALRHGTLPGAACACGPEIARSSSAGDDESLGEAIAWEALRAPAWWLARNAGYDPATELARMAQGTPAGVPCAWDCRFPAGGFLDAVRTGLSSAALAITSDVLVHRPRSLHQADIRP